MSDSISKQKQLCCCEKLQSALEHTVITLDQTVNIIEASLQHLQHIHTLLKNNASFSSPSSTKVDETLGQLIIELQQHHQRIKCRRINLEQVLDDISFSQKSCCDVSTECYHQHDSHTDDIPEEELSSIDDVYQQYLLRRSKPHFLPP